jgi:hypothetical protein
MARRPSEAKRTDGYRSRKAARDAKATHRDQAALRARMAAHAKPEPTDPKGA